MLLAKLTTTPLSRRPVWRLFLMGFTLIVFAVLSACAGSPKLVTFNDKAGAVLVSIQNAADLLIVALDKEKISVEDAEKIQKDLTLLKFDVGQSKRLYMLAGKQDDANTNLSNARAALTILTTDLKKRSEK